MPYKWVTVTETLLPWHWTGEERLACTTTGKVQPRKAGFRSVKEKVDPELERIHSELRQLEQEEVRRFEQIEQLQDTGAPTNFIAHLMVAAGRISEEKRLLEERLERLAL